MSGKVHKLLRRFCDYWHRDYDVYYRRYKKLNRIEKRKVTIAIKKSLPTIN
jgi:hypothetical protein